MYFTTDFDASWTEDKSMTVAITSDGVYRSVFFETAAQSRWAGRIRQLRFHPTNTAGTFSVDYIRVVHTGGQQWLWNTDGNTEGWTAVNEISGFGAAGGVLRGTATGSDPYMQVSGLNVETGAVPQAEIRMKSSGPWAELYWATNIEPSLDENKKINFVLESDGLFHTYFVPISLNWRWQGKATKFRVDPNALAPGAPFEIDYLRLASPTGAVSNFGDDATSKIGTASIPRTSPCPGVC